MASKGIVRWVKAVFDRDAAKKVEDQLTQSLTSAGKKAGQGFLKELRSEFDKRMADLRVKLASGLISPEEFRKAGDKAAKEFNTGVVKGLEAARKSGTLTNAEYLKLSRQLKLTGDAGENAWGRIRSAVMKAGAAVAAFSAVRAIGRFGESAVKEAAESEKVWSELAGTVEAAGESFAKLEANVRAAGEAFQKTTVFSDEDYAKGLQRLIALTGDVDASTHNMGITANIAARFFGGDLAAATEAVAKGMNVGYVTINRVKFSLDDLAQRSMGAAAEATKTFTGRVKMMGNAWSEFKEQLGFALVGSGEAASTLQVLLGFVQQLTTWVATNRGELQSWVGTGITAAVEGIRALSGAVKDYLQLRGLMSMTAGANPMILATTEEGLKAQAAMVEKQRKQLEEDRAKALKALDEVDSKAGLAKQFFSGPAGSIDAIAKGLDLNGKLASINSELEDVETNAVKVANALKHINDEKPPAFTNPLGINKPMLGKNLKEDGADASQRKHFEEQMAALQAESAGLVRIAEAQQRGEVAVAKANQAMEDEKELRSALTGATVGQATALSALITKIQAQRAAIAGVTEFEARRKELLDAVNFSQEITQIGSVAALEHEVEIAKQREVAERNGADALRAFNREQFVTNGLLERGLDLTTELGRRAAEALGKQWDAANKVQTAWTTALEAIHDAAAGIFSSFADGGVRGVVAFAKAQAKLFLAESLGELARGIASLALGPIGGKSAGFHFAASAKMAVAAGAFGAIGASGGGGGSGGSGGGVPTSGGSLASADTGAQPPGPDITIILDGPGFDAMNPRVQEVVFGAQQQARERWGDNANVRVVRRNGP